MKRKPSTVSVVLFIILFVIFYFVEQKLHIFANTINTSSAIETEATNLSNVGADMLVNTFEALFHTNIKL